jgi:hypothetical protein
VIVKVLARKILASTGLGILKLTLCVQQKHDFFFLNSRATTPKKKVRRSTDNKNKMTGTGLHAW